MTLPYIRLDHWSILFNQHRLAVTLRASDWNLFSALRGYAGLPLSYSYFPSSEFEKGGPLVWERAMEATFLKDHPQSPNLFLSEIALASCVHACYHWVKGTELLFPKPPVSQLCTRELSIFERMLISYTNKLYPFLLQWIWFMAGQIFRRPNCSKGGLFEEVTTDVHIWQGGGEAHNMPRKSKKKQH